jgi:lysophospholipase L1-like esterase
MPSVEGKRVVIFGDSLSSGAASPGGVLGSHLNAKGATVKINARVGRSAHNFYGREDTVGQLREIDTFAPHIAIVGLGTNDIGLSLSVDQAKMTQLRDSLARAGATEVWAIGPPSFADATLERGAGSVVDMMRRVFKDRFIDARPLTADMTTAGRTGDGVHFTKDGGSRLGSRLAGAFLGARSIPVPLVVIAAGAVGVLVYLRSRRHI